MKHTSLFLILAILGLWFGTDYTRAAGVAVGSSTLIDQRHYSDTFTTTGNGGAAGRPGAGAFPVHLPGINVENNYGNTARAWTNSRWSIAEDGTVNVGNVANYVGSGAGSATGMTQTGGGVDYGIEYGVAQHFVVQFDSFQSGDRVDIGARSARDTIFGPGLSVFIRPGNAAVQIGLFNGSAEVNSGLTSGTTVNSWHNYAVRFDNVQKVVEVYIDQVSRGTIDLVTFNGGSHNTINNAAVNVGGTGSGDRFWSDNFQVGTPAGIAVPSTTVLGSSANPVVAGDSLTLTATVQQGGVTATAATGTVTFKEGATTLGSGTVASGVATFSTSTLTLGSHSLTAEYGGSAAFLPSTSAPLIQIVQTPGQTATTTELVSSANPSLAGSSLTFTATVKAGGGTAGSATGTMTFKEGAATLGSGAVAGGVATFSISTLTPGAHSITAEYSGDSAFTPSVSPALVQSVQVQTTTALAPAANPDGSYTLTATIQDNGATATGATGSVIFRDHGVTVSTSAVAGGVATFRTFAIGSRSLTAEYSGSGSYTPSASAGAVILTINAAVLSTHAMLNGGAASNAFTHNSSNSIGMEIVRSFHPGNYPNAAAVPYTAAASPTVDLSLYGPVLGFQAGNIGANVHGRGGLMFAPGDGETTGSNSGGVGFGGHSPWLITFDLDKLRAPGAANANLLATLSGRFCMNGLGSPGEVVNPGGIVQGIVFVDGVPAFTSGLKSVSSASDAINLTLTTASRWVTCVIAAGDNATFYDDGTFRDMQLSVYQPLVTTTSLTSSVNPSLLNSSVTFTATVQRNGATETTATGSVVFKDGATILDTVTVSAGVAAFSSSALAVGLHSITAEYSGDTLLAASSSAALPQVVQAPAQTATTTELVSSSNPSFTGSSVTFSAMVKASGATATSATGTVVFKNGAATLGSGPVSGGVATFSSGALPPGANSITAEYSGDVTFTASASPALVQSVLNHTTTALAAAGNPDGSHTFTGTVQDNGATAGSATGTMIFRDSGVTVATSSVSGGVAAFRTFAIGSRSVTAEYSGDAGYASSASSAVPLTINSAVLSTNVMLNGGAASNAFTHNSSNTIGMEIVRNYNPGNFPDATAIPYTAAASPTVDLSLYGPVLGFQAGNFGANVHGRGGNMFAPGDGETTAGNNGGVGFGGHSPWLITFDLNKIRAPGAANASLILTLSGRFCMNGLGSPGEVVNPGGIVQGIIFVDGLPVFTSGMQSISTPSGAFSLSLTTANRWLTFAIAAGDNSTFYDDGTFRDAVLTKGPSSPYEQFIAANYPGLSDTENDMDDDPDLDGITNIVEWSAGTDLTASSTGPITWTGNNVTGHGLPVISANGSALSLVFGRRDNYVAEGLTYIVEFSSDLSDWEASTESPSLLATDGAIDAVSVPFPSGAAPRWYARVRVTSD